MGLQLLLEAGRSIYRIMFSLAFGQRQDDCLISYDSVNLEPNTMVFGLLEVSHKHFLIFIDHMTLSLRYGKSEEPNICCSDQSSTELYV